MAHKLELVDIRDFINLTYCCQQATVITDFSNLEAVGCSHFLNINGGCARMEELESLNGEEAAHLLIDSGGGVITPYGVVYDNDMVLEQQYNGHQFPVYPYDGLFMGLEITPKHGLAEGKNPEHLYLPALNRMCRAIVPLNEADQEKLNAVVLMTEPGDMMAVQQLAENLDQFDFIPGIHTPEEYGKYMIQKSGHLEYDEELEGFYDYRRYGEQRIRQEGGHSSTSTAMWHIRVRFRWRN